ncbi:aldo/keto reductase, partial [Escherichia coli]
AEGDWRRSGPRWQEDTFAQNMAIVDKVRTVAERRSATNAQVALAWVLSRGEDILPIPGTKRLKYLEDNVGADQVVLTQQDIEELDGFEAV